MEFSWPHFPFQLPSHLFPSLYTNILWNNDSYSLQFLSSQLFPHPLQCFTLDIPLIKITGDLPVATSMAAHENFSPVASRMTQLTSPSCLKHFLHVGFWQHTHLLFLFSVYSSTFCNSNSPKPHQHPTTQWGPLTRPGHPQTSQPSKVWTQWMQTIKCTKSQRVHNDT